MSTSGKIKTMLMLTMLVFGNLSGQAAELHLKPEYVCSRPVVRLADIAEIREPGNAKAANALEQIELFTAPSARTGRTVKASELRELLTLHGVDMNDLQFRGANEVRIRPVATSTAARTKPQATRLIATSARTLHRGETIRSSDVEFKSVSVPAGKSDSSDSSNAIDSADKVVGYAVTRSLQAGDTINATDLMKPIAVQRNEIIALVARSSGVQVRTSVKALEAGAVGDLIAIETQDKDKNRLTARIVGPKAAEIFAGLPTVSATK